MCASGHSLLKSCCCNCYLQLSKCSDFKFKFSLKHVCLNVHSFLHIQFKCLFLFCFIHWLVPLGERRKNQTHQLKMVRMKTMIQKMYLDIDINSSKYLKGNTHPQLRLCMIRFVLKQMVPIILQTRCLMSTWERFICKKKNKAHFRQRLVFAYGFYQER